MCRHCVAVVLEYHRWVSLRLKRDGSPLGPAGESHKGNGKAPAGTGHAVNDLKLSEVMGFVEWIHAAIKGMETREPLPDSPQLGPSLAADWISAIKELDRQRQEGVEVRQALQKDVSLRDAQIQQVRQQLKTVHEELEGAKAKSQNLERNLAGYQAIVAKLTALSREICQFDQQIKAVSGDLTKSGSQLEQLSRAFRDVAAALLDLGKQQP
jgi:septal ring factor EnvC (AmiA/AmiB activator)